MIPDMGRIRGEGLTSNQLKAFALAVMTVDHIAAVLLPIGDVYYAMRLLGRLAFPIYAWLLVQGNLKTRSRGRYLLRLGIFALIAEVPFDLAVCGSPRDMSGQNVFFTLFLGEAMLWLFTALWERCGIPAGGREDRKVGELLPGQPLVLAGTVLIWVVFMFPAELLYTDYGAGGIILIGMLSLLQPWDDRAAMSMALGSFAMWLFGGSGWLQACAGAAFLFPICLHNGRRGSRNRLLQYGFYAYYPLHLLILAGIRGMMG